MKKEEPKKPLRMPNKNPRTGWWAEEKAYKDLFIERCGLEEHECDRVIGEVHRIRGYELKENLMFRRIWKSEQLLVPAGDYIRICMPSENMREIAEAGPFEKEESEHLYDDIIRLCKFDPNLIIHKPIKGDDDLFAGLDDDDDLFGDLDDDDPNDLFGDLEDGTDEDDLFADL